MAGRFSKETEALILRLKAMKPSKRSFELAPGRFVVDPKVFHKSLLAEISYGPRGPDWRESALRQELELYLAYLEGLSE